MTKIQTEKIKYGIGITADYSPLALYTRKFGEGSIEAPGEQKTLEIHEKEIGISSNPLFAYLADTVADHREVIIEADTELFSLPIEALDRAAGAYIRVVVRAGVKATIHEKIVCKELTGTILDVIVEDGAMVTYIADQRASDTSYVLALRRAFVAKDAQMTWIDLSLGSSIANSSMYTVLDGNGSRGNTYGAFFGTGSQLMDITHTTIHRAEHTSSNLKTHGALDKQAKGLFRSLIDIRENAAHTSGHQKEETLLLSRDAQISSVPDLEIANNEVSCSHGVSTTNIDDESLFYFHSRGMSTEIAKQTIVEGHVGSIVDEITDGDVRDEIMNYILRKMGNRSPE